MPLVLLALMLPTGALAFRSVTDGITDTTENAGPNLVVLGAAGLGLYLAYKALNKK
jgi:hypothetical protein